MSFGTALPACLTVFAALSSFFHYVSAYPNPEPCNGNCSGVHDPTLIRRTSDGTWFRLSTNGNIAIASAPDITGPWTYDGAMLPDGSIIDLPIDNPGIWAPDVHLIEETYFAYYSVSTSGSQTSDIGVATSGNLEVDSWTDHGSIGIANNSVYNRIDPNWFQESDSSPVYFAFGSSWSGTFETELDPSSPLEVSPNAAGPENLVYNSTIPPGKVEPAIVEGGYLFWRVVDGVKYYFMFFSSGKCCNPANDLAAAGDEYKIMVCRSDSPAGPFVDQDGKDCLTENGGTLVLGSHGEVYAPGGQGVYNHASLRRPVLYYHYVNTSIGYDFEQFQFGFNHLDFSSTWPVVVV
ncbi:hypothetical protein AAFC00_002634 [Neodothiora populina]|uniref:Arabinan endo-1,5-alpha-L-arabinosidase n=1 Tax=Neodothiora populina TaxID=2781224 RepID=A0ABR3P809_9PEZI